MANDFTTGFSDIVNPQQPQVDVQQYIRPPASPEEYQQRLSGWSDFGKAIRENPVLQMTLMRFAANMLQGRQPGQSTASAVAEGGLDAMAYGGRAAAGMEQQQQQRETHQADIARTKAATASSEAQTAETKQRTAFAAARQPLEMETANVALAAQKVQLAREQYDQAVRDQVSPVEKAKTERALRIAEQNLRAAQAMHAEQQGVLAAAQAGAINEGRTKNGAMQGGGKGAEADIRKRVMRIDLKNGLTELRTMNPDETYTSEFEQTIPGLFGIDAQSQAIALVQGQGIDPKSAEGKKAIAQKMVELAQPRRQRYVQDANGNLVPVSATKDTAASAPKQRVWDAKTKQWVE